MLGGGNYLHLGKRSSPDASAYLLPTVIAGGLALLIFIASRFLNPLWLVHVGLLTSLLAAHRLGLSRGLLFALIVSLGIVSPLIATTTSWLYPLNMMAGYGLVALIVGASTDQIRRQNRQMAEQQAQLLQMFNEYETIFNGTQSAMFLAEVTDDHAFRYLRNNQTHQKATGLTLCDLKGKTPHEIAGDEQGEIIAQRYKKCITSGRSLRYEETLVLAGEEKTWVTVLSPVIDADGRITHIVGSSEDITYRKTMQQQLETQQKQLREDNQLLQSILDHAPIGIWLVDREQDPILVNHAFQAATGLGTEALSLSNAELKTCKETDEITLEQGTPQEFEETITFTDGRRHVLRTIKAPLHDDSGDTIGVLGLGLDITDQKRQEAALRENKEKYRSLVENLNEIVYRLDRDARVTYVSPNITPISGYEPGEIIGRRFTAFVHPDDQEKRRPQFENAMAGANDPTEYRFVKKDGSIRWVRTSARPILRNGQAIGVQGVLTDITERKRMENRLKDNEEKYRALVEQSTEMMFLHDLDGNFLEVNRAAVHHTGYRQDELLNMSVFDLLATSDSEASIRSQWIKWGAGSRPLTIESKYRLKSGEIISVEISTGKIAFGGDAYILALVRDITERKQFEEALRHKSFHDRLTGLYNRHFMEEELERLDTRRQLPISIIMADLNGLKLVNDTYGHHTGDKMLKRAANLLKTCCRSEDLIARWGGDEFIILLPKTDHDAVERILQRIQDDSQEAFISEIPFSITLGSATKTADRPDRHLKRVLAEAEDEMYRYKLIASRSQKSAVVNTLLRTLQEKSFETEQHTRRMKDYALLLGQALGLPTQHLNHLGLLTRLHDIGKINIPETLLTKKGTLTPKEFEIIKKHPETGYRIALATDEFAHIAQDILAHHEWWDGTGYPHGLSGEAIPLLARIIAIADAFEVMTNGRPYRPPISKDDAISDLLRGCGTQFDPELVTLFADCLAHANHRVRRSSD